MRWYTVIWHGLDQARHTYEVCACHALHAVALTLRHFPHAQTAWMENGGD